MKKLLSLILTLALVVGAISIVDSSPVSAATKATNPSIVATNCKTNYKKIDTFKNLTDAITQVYYGNRNTYKVDKIKITNIKNKHGYIKITAPANGVLYLQGITGTGYGSDDGVKNYDQYPVKAYYPSNNSVDNLVVEAPELLDGDNDTLVEYPMYSGEVVYLHFTKDCEFMAAWVSSKDIMTVTNYDKSANLTIDINIGTTDSSKYSIYGLDTNSSASKTTYKDYLKAEGRSKASLGIYYDNSAKYNAKDNGHCEVTTNLEALENRGYLVTFIFDIQVAKGVKVRTYIAQFYSNILSYNDAYVYENTPDPWIMKAKTNVVMGYAKSNSKVCIKYKNKIYTRTSDSNGLFVVKLGAKLTSKSTFNIYYDGNTISRVINVQ